jgi:hypothetical protein
MRVGFPRQSAEPSISSSEVQCRRVSHVAQKKTDNRAHLLPAFLKGACSLHTFSVMRSTAGLGGKLTFAALGANGREA